MPWDARQVRNLSTGGHDEPPGDAQPNDRVWQPAELRLRLIRRSDWV